MNEESSWFQHIQWVLTIYVMCF